MLDDYLMYTGARNISAGNWLGQYSYLTIGKHMLFSAWLALLNSLGVPYLLAGHVLYLGACFAVVFAFSPLIKSNWFKFVFFAALAFNPAAFADFTLRVYRDNITTSFFLLVFAAVVGFALRCRGEKLRALWLYSALGGFALGASFLLREDGVWLLPFVVLGLGVSAFFFLRSGAKKKLRRVLAMSLFGVVAAGVVLIYCGLNYSHYGKFAVSDMTSGPFADAYGAITRVELEDYSYNLAVPVPREARALLYEESPAFKELEPYLESDILIRWRRDYGDGKLEYGGSFYWAVRAAASAAGYYETPEKADAYFARLADEINAACDSGALPARAKRSSINPPIRASHVVPTIGEVFSGLGYTALYIGIDNSPTLSVGPTGAIEEMEQYLNNKSVFAQPVSTLPDNRIEFWAVSANGVVGTALIDTNGEPVPFDHKLTTGSDVYVDYLLNDGVDYLYSHNIRHHLTTSAEPVSLRLVLNDGKSQIIVPLAQTSEPVMDNGISYSIEYVGRDCETGFGFGALQLWMYRLMRVLVWVYRLGVPLLLIGASVALFPAIGAVLKIRKTKFRSAKKIEERAISALGVWITLGVFAMALLRLGIVAFAEVASFDIGTNPMYLAIVYPLLLWYAFAALALWRRGGGKWPTLKKTKKPKKKTA